MKIDCAPFAHLSGCPVAATALRRVTRCDCGEETSCYGCLRNFRNQTVHDQLTRGAALDFLERLV